MNTLRDCRYNYTAYFFQSRGYYDVWEHWELGGGDSSYLKVCMVMTVDSIIIECHINIRIVS